MVGTVVQVELLQWELRKQFKFSGKTEAIKKKRSVLLCGFSRRLYKGEVRQLMSELRKEKV